jgi:hypothetical protein
LFLADSVEQIPSWKTDGCPVKQAVLRLS